MERPLRAGSGGAAVVALLVALSGSVTLSAHRLDEYLQASRIDVRPDGATIELDLTPGIEVAESIIGIIDRDGGGSMSASEQTAYATEVMQALRLTVDGQAVALRVIAATFPEPVAFRRGEGTIRVQLSAEHARLPPGAHQLFFSNAHLRTQSVYLANALVPGSSRVSVTGQHRAGDQSELRIAYTVGPEALDLRPAWILLGLAGVAAVKRVRDGNAR
jgi:hypothetical protein